MNLLQTQKDIATFELSPIKAIELEASKIPGAVSLAQGIPSFETPLVIREFVKEQIDRGLCDRYSLPNGLLELRETISLSLEEEGLSYDPDGEIVVTAGSIGAITASLLACTEPGDEVILPSPTYASYIGGISMGHCVAKYVPLDEENNFDFSVDKLRAAITRRTKVILYCSPNNPTGTLVSPEKTRELVKLAQEHNIYLIVDEVYKDFYYTDDQHFSPAQVEEAKSSVIRVCSFSKAFAMTGWRVGFLASDRSIVRRILKFHDAMVTCAPVVSQYAAIAALRLGGDWLSECRELYRQRRNYCIERLDQLTQVLDYQLPKATYFVFPRIKDSFPLASNSTALAYDMLKKVKVAVVPGIAFGPSGESHIRINFGRDPEVLSEGMDRLAEYFTSSPRSVIMAASSVQTPPSTNLPVSSPQASFSVLRELAKTYLGMLAKLYLKRHRPTIIGIAGAGGKTVYKRKIRSLLSKERSCRANIRSYNTEIGLPLAVLDLYSPRSTGEKLLLPFRALWKLLRSGSESEFLILEFGVASEADAKALYAVAKPDFLVITGIENYDASSSQKSGIASGIKYLGAMTEPHRILFPANDAYLNEASGIWERGNGVKLDWANLVNGRLVTLTTTYPMASEPVGHSSVLATLAAVYLSEALGLSKDAIERWLAKNNE